MNSQIGLEEGDYEDMVLSDKDSRMPIDLPDLIPGSGTGTGYVPPQHDDDFDIASAYSLATTPDDLVIEHGRRYQSYRYGSSPFPRGDKLARENEDWLHRLMLCLLDDKPFIAPLGKAPENVLDVRCGVAGYWAKLIADLYEDCQVTGLDVSRVDNDGRSNLEFLIQSYNDEWILDEVTQAHGKFDLIYARQLFATSNDFPYFYKQCFDFLEPGGFLEQSEFVPVAHCDDDQFNPEARILKLSRLAPELGQTFGTDYNLASKMRKYVEEAGFVDIKEETVKMPWSPWPTPGTKHNRIGAHLQKFLETGMQGWILQPMIKMGYTKEQVDAECEEVFKELSRNDQHFYFTSVYITARKPIARPG